MIWLVIVLAVVALALAVLAGVTARRLRSQRAATAASEERAARLTKDVAELTAGRQAAEQERDAATERATAAESRVKELTAEVQELTARTAEAEQRITAAEADRDSARRDAETAGAARAEAQARLATLEQQLASHAAAEEAASRAAEAAPTVTGELDAQVVWALERSRSERTWRQSVAVDPHGSAFTDGSQPLVDALQVELDAAREEVGAVVELDADVPIGISAAGSVLALKAAQELLADVIRQAETTTLRVRADGSDLLVEIDAADEHGNRVEPGPLPTPESDTIQPTANGVRIRDAIPAPH